MFLEKVAQVCLAKGWSVESAKSCVALVEDPAVLAAAMVELAAQVTGGKCFVQGTCNLEIRGFGVVIADDQFARIEAALDAGIPLPALCAAAARAAAHMKPLKDAKDATVAVLEAAHVAAKAALAQLAVVVPEAAAVDAAAPVARGGGGGRRVAPRQDYAAMAGGMRTAAERAVRMHATERAVEAAAKAEKATATAAVEATPRFWPTSRPSCPCCCYTPGSTSTGRSCPGPPSTTRPSRAGSSLRRPRPPPQQQPQPPSPPPLLPLPPLLSGTRPHPPTSGPHP